MTAVRESERAATYEASRQSQRIVQLEAAAAAARAAEQHRASTASDQARAPCFGGGIPLSPAAL